MPKLVKLISTDGEPREMETNDPRMIQFVKDMNKAGMPWRWYSGRGMYGAECPAVVTQTPDLTEEMIIRATTVSGLKRDTLGRETIIYTGS